jgi:hypothetical protein
MRPARRPIALLLLVWFLPTCATYQTTELAPHEAVVGHEAVKVTLADESSAEVTVWEPWVRADSIGGVVDRNDNWSAPLASVAVLKTKQANAWLTLGVVVGGAALALGGFVLFCAASDCYNQG